MLTGDLNEAVSTCDYLEMLLKFLQKQDNDVKLSLSEDGEELIKHSNFSDHLQPLIDRFDISGKIEDLSKVRNDIAVRMENPSYDLERRMHDLVATERYEEAAKIRDELKRIHQS